MDDYKKVDRGDVVLIDFNPQSGREIKGNRYALVLSPNLFNRKTGFASVCPISNTKRDFGYEVDVPESVVSITTIQEGVKSYLTGVVLTHQLKNLDIRSRRLKIVGKMDEETTRECLDYVLTFLE